MRGTSRREAGLAAIEEVGLEPALADPDRVGTVLDGVEGVTLVFWLRGSAAAEPDRLAAIHGPRLERMLEEIVDTPVRGFVYEGSGSVAAELRESGSALVRAASDRWRIPVVVTSGEPADREAWRAEMLAAASKLIGGVGASGERLYPRGGYCSGSGGRSESVQGASAL